MSTPHKRRDIHEWQRMNPTAKAISVVYGIHVCMQQTHTRMQPCQPYVHACQGDATKPCMHACMSAHAKPDLRQHVEHSEKNHPTMCCMVVLIVHGHPDDVNDKRKRREDPKEN
eukprot:366217-Chlamydomonas_euryale.AAC.12